MTKLSSDTIEKLKRVSAHNRDVLGVMASDKPAKSSIWSGWMEVGGKRCYFRSRWEANYACWLEYRKSVMKEIADWRYEPVTFWFEGIKRGVCSYKPDFLITLHDGSSYLDEVKGFMDPRSKTKLKRMAKYYPDVTINVVSATWFKEHRRLAKLVPGWHS